MRDSSRLEVYWSRLADNWATIQSLAPQAKILPMIKANAYGHGLIEVGQFLERELKAKTLGVASLGEALHLKASGVSTPVLVFSETLLHLPDKFSSYADSIIPVVHDWDGLQNFLQHPQFRSHPLVLKLDTGMNRLGLAQDLWEAAINLIKASGRKSVQHLMSHFATSYYPQKPGDMIERQMKSFQRAKDLFLSQLSVEETSMSNSGAIEQGLMVNESWVRPGLMLYGPGSFQTKTKMVSRFVTHVLKTMLVDRGTPIGYGVYVTPDKALVVYLPIGYGDGFFTQSSGHKIVIDGFEGKVFGRVNMDMTAVLMPAEAQNKIKVGDRVFLWDEDPAPIVEWATHMQTHAYQALCGISSRIPRVYHVK